MKRRTIFNIVLTWLYQAVVIASGIIIPKLILNTFGSEINGLISSANQFLNYIYIVEGGLGGVVLANLYKPLILNDEEKLSKVIRASALFFRIVGLIFAVYSVGLAITYPLIVKTSIGFWGVFWLVIILAINLFTQYCFSISLKLLLQADQKIYVVHLVNISTGLLNIVFSIIVVRVFPSIHILKLITAFLFTLQPLVYGFYVKKHYSIKRIKCNYKEELPDRWSCFGHNLAFFVNTNTDISILTLVKGLVSVSIYSVHIMVTTGLKNLINALSQVFSPRIGTAIAYEDKNMIEKEIDLYEFVTFFISTIIFSTCACLITPFISIYVSSIQDSFLYFQPVFAILITLAEFLCCLRNPYEAATYGLKQFKAMSYSAYIEAGINISVSLILVWRFGLIGIVIGTCLAVSFRLIWYIVYLRISSLKRSVCKPFKRLVASLSIIMSSYFIFTFLFKIEISNYGVWFLVAIATFFAVCLITFLTYLVVDYRITKRVLLFLFVKKKKE